MGLAFEIERKFLVHGDQFLRSHESHIKIRQGYLSTDPSRIVRVRLNQYSDGCDSKGILTIKGLGCDQGISRLEWETEIVFSQAEKLFDLCLPSFIEKTRYFVPYKGFNFEVDVFDGANRGLILAEIELPEVNTEFERPVWLGEEVTHQERYSNAALSHQPFTLW